MLAPLRVSTNEKPFATLLATEMDNKDDWGRSVGALDFFSKVFFVGVVIRDKKFQSNNYKVFLFIIFIIYLFLGLFII